MESKLKYPKIHAMIAYHGETKSYIANLLGMTKSQLYKRLRGEVEWKIDELKTLKNHYECGFDDLL